jgi:hypothetical protein
MERMTFEGNFCEIARCGYPTCPYKDGCSQKQVWEQLKRYEDTKRTPEQIETLEAAIMGKAVAQITEFEGLPIARLRELAVADKDGRCVVLPCKVGDVVYGFHGEKTILPMVAKWIETNTDGWCIAVQYTPMAPRFYRFSDFGKTVFLTREEAKKALQEMEGK